ncbi:MAG: transketolase family protein [Bacteroides sp.]
MDEIERHSMREGFAQGVKEVAAANSDVILLGCDITRSLFLHDFGKQFPSQYLSIGIAEQNAASIAAGLALCGKRPILASYAAFITTRALDQIRMSICYNELNIFIAGAHAGLSPAQDGGSHQSLEDIAVMRSLPKITVVLPCDANETAAAVRYYLGGTMERSVYLRFGRNEIPELTPHNQSFQPGAKLWRTSESLVGRSIAIITSGALVSYALDAAHKLERECNIFASVLQIRTLGDGMADALVAITVASAEIVFVFDEHRQHGGVCSYVLECAAKHKVRSKFFLRGVEDNIFGESGYPEILYWHTMLDEDGMFNSIKRACKLPKLEISY